jgi:hypothetical protein
VAALSQGEREERESALLVRAALLRKLAERDADPRLRDLLAETESALLSMSVLPLGGDSPAPSGAGSFLEPTHAA